MTVAQSYLLSYSQILSKIEILSNSWMTNGNCAGKKLI